MVSSNIYIQWYEGEDYQLAITMHGWSPKEQAVRDVRKVFAKSIGANRVIVRAARQGESPATVRAKPRATGKGAPCKMAKYHAELSKYASTCGSCGSKL